MLTSITEFFPPGTRMRSPAGLSFDVSEVASVATGLDNELRITLRGGVDYTITFHRNADGGPAETWKIRNNIVKACDKYAITGYGQ